MNIWDKLLGLNLNLGKNSSNSGEIVDNSKNSSVVIKGKYSVVNILPEETIKKINSELEEKIKNVSNLEHITEIENFLNDGIKSNIDITNFVADKIGDFVAENEYSTRHCILDALFFLKESNAKQKKILVWSFLLTLFQTNVNCGTIESFNEILNVVRKSVYKIEPEFYFRQVELGLFVKLGQVINDVRNLTFEKYGYWKKRKDENDIIKGYTDFPTFEEFKKSYQEFSVSDKRNSEGLYNICYIASGLPESLKIAARALLKKININFK